MVLLAFLGMSLAWSFSWFVMKLQVDSIVPPELSVFYRIFFTSIIMFAICFITKQRTTITKNEFLFFIFIGITNFCINFLIGYFAVKFIASGMLATIFSLSIITSEIISSFVNKRKIERKVVISSIVGFIGLAFFILPMIKFDVHADMIKTLAGVALSIVMMIIYSIGNVLVGKNKKMNATPLYTSIAYGTGIGSFFLLLINVSQGNNFVFDFSAQYVFSLAYLVLIASVIAFICLFYLIQEIGSAKANYTALVYPVIALVTSAYFENFHFTFLSGAGFVMIISALAIEFVGVRKL